MKAKAYIVHRAMCDPVLEWSRPKDCLSVEPLYKPQPASTTELREQKPVAWMPIEQMYPQAKAIDILMGDGSILCAVLPQFDGDLWWEGSGTGEKFIDPKYANVTHWRIHDERTSPPASTTELREQEPVAWVEGEEIYWNNAPDLNDWIRQNGQPLYTSPQAQRTWVGLTDEEIDELRSGYQSGRIGSFVALARAIEAKLKEKNNG